MYIFPKGAVDAAALAMISRSRVPYADPLHLYEVYEIAAENDISHALVQLSLEQTALLTRYGGELAPSDVTLLVNVPGIVYRSDWMMAAAALPRIDWMEMEGRLAKSGLVAFSSATRAEGSRAPSILPLAVQSEEDNDAITNQA